MGMLRNLLFVGVGLFALYAIFGDSLTGSSAQTADLGKVLDRTEYAINAYEGFAQEKQMEKVGEEEMKQFTAFLTGVMNADPRFYDDPIGLELMQDASFKGFADKNGDGIQDSGEAKIFTIEIDGENRRLIATDTASGSGSHLGMGTGFLAGMLIGNLMNRQSAAGVQRGAFNNRNTTARSAYSAPASSRTASARSSSRSGGFSSGK